MKNFVEINCALAAKKKILSLLAISAIVLGMASCGDNDPVNQIVVNPNSENGMMSGKFTVDAQGTKVRFSQGNLQYNASSNIWKFATNQWDTIGIANSQIGKEDYKGWIDLFGWSTGENPTESSTSDSDYKYPFVDWGKKNAIANGNNNVGQWHTLSKDEWYYIFYKRDNAQKKFGLGSVNGINGVILLPDDWDMPTTVKGFQPSVDNGLEEKIDYYHNDAENANNFADNTYSAAEWNVMEKAGAIFLPATGYRKGVEVHDVGSKGYYWSSAPGVDETRYAHDMHFHLYNLNPQGYISRYYGHSVRLVR